MTITKERLQTLIDNPIDERIMNHERQTILKMALSSIELHTDSLQNYRETLEAYQDYIKSLQAEIEHLRNTLMLAQSEVNLCHKDFNFMNEEIYHLKAENARLREALENILRSNQTLVDMLKKLPVKR